MTRQRWTRAEAGVYTLGDWTLQGKGTKWELIDRRAGAVMRRARSKGELQRWVADGGGEPERELEPEPPRARRSATAAPVDSVESVLASLRLEVEQLTLAVRELTTRLDRR